MNKILNNFLFIIITLSINNIFCMQKTKGSQSLKKGWIDLDEEPERIKKKELKEAKKSSEKKEKLSKQLEDQQAQIQNLQVIIESLKQPDNQNIVTEVDTLKEFTKNIDQRVIALETIISELKIANEENKVTKFFNNVKEKFLEYKDRTLKAIKSN